MAKNNPKQLLGSFNGKVLWFDDKLGYGFVECEEFEKNIFIHHSRVQSNDDFKTLSKGQLVSFEVAQTEKGFMAVNLRENKVAKPKTVVVTNQ